MRIEDFIHQFSLTEAEAPVTTTRREYEALHASRRRADPAGMRVRDERVADVKIRRFQPARCRSGVVVYLHGGGWNLGSVDSHHGITADLAERLQREVVSVDYRLLPEASYAEALADCHAVVETTAPVAVIGDSAGGRLAIDVAHGGEWQGLLGLIYPVVGTPTAATLGEDAPLLSRADVLSLWQMAAPDVPAIPGERPPTPTIEVLAVERDPLTRPLETAVEAWRQAGASVGYRRAPGMVHSALHGHAELPPMQIAWQDFCQAIERRLEGS
ncbi:alpha/beta hydrolase fold domain-containing protein [Salinicola acroporae]|uniref:Lipolytic protein n=1 Tax=Salinicola acroporae TaxID=1541440 RepID=A0ABT6I3X3_9GAMM|nr:alpha/beta hydrolase fold domain-containing protein [Salinicola acroporae]MDH4572394.1 lipolytic protein [Salinicola acroporae]